MISKMASIVIIVAGLVLMLLGIVRVTHFVDVPDLTVAGAVLVGAGVVGLALTERPK